MTKIFNDRNQRPHRFQSPTLDRRAALHVFERHHHHEHDCPPT